MKHSVSLAAIVLCLLFVNQAMAGSYALSDSIVGPHFFDAFSFQAIEDPTYGTVHYVDESTAKSKGLVSSTKDRFTLRADDFTKLSAKGRGRDSLRVRSKKQYTTHVAVFDINHMPEGCGTWPAVWDKGDPWPYKGEADIIEGVNSQGTNEVTLHTSRGCTMPSSRTMTGTARDTDCQGGNGCGVFLKETSSFGPIFNSIGGGWYALERTRDFIKVWFWSRSDKSVPDDVKKGALSVETDRWGIPSANFLNTHCDFTRYFGSNYIVINLDFCGEWAGNATLYTEAGCPGTCDEYVRNNPAAFSAAFFDFASIRIYE
ncbi:glycoside hydrolase family 16 protein [Piloderma croceum F 1598]|uniref:Glycoside hydrolase family 16 protein n=1 Tax=Piloderma croceum (strain F 1598) TaxID=765440 RepID=A0A0C3FDC4_PILCF|nr:glycoside hydrolase family 16 protein [Piloderma croceum F 1598]